MLNKITHGIDAISNFVAKVAKWLVFVVVFEMAFEVFSRYVLNKPTVWSYDISYMLGGAFFCLGLCYVQRIDKHVRVDVFYAKFAPKTQKIIDIIMNTLVFFPTFGLLLAKMIPDVMASIERGERAVGSFWAPPLWPIRVVLLISVALLILQTLSNYLKDWQTLVSLCKRGDNK